MPKPKSPKQKPIASVDEFKAVVDCIAQADLARQKLNLALEAKIAALREAAAPQIDAFDKEIATALKAASKFAKAKRGELLPKDRQSAFTALAEFGFRKGTPALSLLSGHSWQDVVEAIQARIAELESAKTNTRSAAKAQEIQTEIDRWKGMLCIIVEPVKDQIKTVLSDAERADIGTEITTKETFWVAPKKEKQETTTSVEQKAAA